MNIRRVSILLLFLVLMVFTISGCRNSNNGILSSSSMTSSELEATTSKAAVSKAAEYAAAASEAAAKKAAADAAAASKAAASKAAADAAAASEAAASKAAADAASKQAQYLSQFTWHDNNFGVIIDSATTDGYGFFTANGRAISLKSKSYTYVAVNIGLYSNSGSKLGDAIANINNLSAGTTWQFKAIGSISSSGSCKYKVESVDAW